MNVTFYDSLEEMYEAEEKARKAADSRTQDWQKKLESGDYFCKDSGYGFPIFGQVLKRHEEKFLENYRLCDCYSVAVPNGERGDVHVSTIDKKLSKDEFNSYKEKNWTIGD